jgi:hypothetical protein
LKENQPDLLREAERFTIGPPATAQSDPKQELRCWHLPQVDWPVADRLVRVVKTVRIDHKRQVTVSQDGEHLKKSKSDVALESTNFYATNFDLGSIPPTFIHQLSRADLPGVRPDAAAALFPPAPKINSAGRFVKVLAPFKTQYNFLLPVQGPQLTPNQRAACCATTLCGIAAALQGSVAGPVV